MPHPGDPPPELFPHPKIDSTSHMNTVRILPTLGLALAGLFTASLGFSQALYVDNFDALEAGPLPGYPYAAFGGLVAATVIDSDSVSGPNAVALQVDFTGANAGSFGVVFSRYIDYNPTTDGIGVDLTNGTIAVDIKSSVDLTGKQPLVAFRIGTVGGDTMVRTAEAQYFTPTTEFTTYSVAASSLSLYEAGENIDLSAIREISVIIYNLGEGVAGTFTLDNLRAYVTPAAVPEPAGFACVAGAVLLGFVSTRRRRES